MTNTDLARQKLREVEKALDAWAEAKELAHELHHTAFSPSRHPEPYSDKVTRLNEAIRLAKDASNEVALL
jgi:hypothetical protein